MVYVCFALAGVLAGGVIATRQQKKPMVATIVLAVLAALFLVLGLKAGG